MHDLSLRLVGPHPTNPYKVIWQRTPLAAVDEIDYEQRGPCGLEFSDFRRYIYRALHNCRRDIVNFFVYRKPWFALAPVSDCEKKLCAANAAFDKSNAKRVSLEKLPPLRVKSRRNP